MKNKFERLSKEEQKAAIKEYSTSNEINENIYKRLRKLHILGIVGIIYSTLVLFLDILKEYDILDYTLGMYKGNTIVNYVLDATLLIFCVFFVVKGNQMIREQVNKYLIEKSKSKTKK